MIEVTVRDFLSTKLSVPCYLEVPKTPPTDYVVLEKTGSSKDNHIHESTFTMQAYSTSMYKASNLIDVANAALEELIELDEVSRVYLNSSYNYTDTTTKKYRYQSVYVITHY